MWHEFVVTVTFLMWTSWVLAWGFRLVIPSSSGLVDVLVVFALDDGGCVVLVAVVVLLV